MATQPLIPLGAAAPVPAPSVAYVTFSAEVIPHTAESLIAAMSNLANQGIPEVHLLLSTPGGSVMNGMNVYNVIRALPFTLVTHNVGNVDSIGNAIFLAGDQRYACPESTFMFHGVNIAPQVPQLAEQGLVEGLAVVRSDQKRIAAIIEQRSTLTASQIKRNFLRAKTMNATEAVSAGIVDQIQDVQIPPGAPVLSLVFQR